MKRSIQTSAAALVLCLSVSTLSFAQDIAAGSAVQTTSIVPSAVENNTSEATAKASFSILFPNARQPKWAAVADNSFVSFWLDGRKARASFSAKGIMNYVITDCSQDNLPVVFSKTIKQDYAAYKLFHAIEIKAHGVTAYQAILESAVAFITLRYTTDGIEEIQKVKK